MENNRILPARIKILLSYLNENLSGKEEAIRLTLLSAIARESILLLGSSGLDKIALIRCVATAFRHFYGSGYQCFEYFMNDSSVPEDLRFSGETIAFFDDIWASNPAVLNKLLAIINNKSAFVAAGSKEGDPYKAAEVKRFEALRESFALYVPVNPISDDSAFFTFVESADFCPKPNENEKAALLGINEIENWQPAIGEVRLSDDAKNLISEIRRKCFDYFVSDFRWKKIVRILKTKLVPSEYAPENDTYIQRYMAAALLKGAVNTNAYTPDKPYTVEMTMSPNGVREAELMGGEVTYTYILAHGWDTFQRGVELFLPYDTEYYKVSGCSSCYTQCKNIRGGEWPGLD